MQPIHWSRVILGGVAATAVVFVVDGIAAQAYFGELTRTLAAHDLTFVEGPGAVALFALLYGIAGFGVTWLYAAILPRHGEGIRTALIAGAVAWALYFVPAVAAWASIGVFRGWVIPYTLAIGLVAMALAAVVAAWIYRDPKPEAGPVGF